MKAPDLPPEDQALFDRLAHWIVERGLETPAILFLETSRPLSFVGSQTMYFLAPFAHAIFAAPDYDRFARLLERREHLEIFMRTIERAADVKDREAREKKRARKNEGRKADDA